MRNPLARLVHRDPAKPTLRERAANLKASASRVIRRKSVADAASSPAQYDPIFNLIDQHRAALAAWEPHLEVTSRIKCGTPAFEAAEEAGRESQDTEIAAIRALVAARPATLGGLLALAEYLPDALVRTGMCDNDETGLISLRNVCHSVLQQAGAIIEERDPVLDLIAAHERAYGQRLFCSAYKPGTSAERLAIQAEERAYRAFLHLPLSTDGGRVAYATAVFNREMHKPTPRVEGIAGRDHPLAVAGRNLGFGEYARETWPGGRLAVSSVEAPHTPEISTDDEAPHADADLIALGRRFDEERDAWLALVPASQDAVRRVQQFEASIKRARGDLAPADFAASWRLPGVVEAHNMEEEAFGQLEQVTAAIRAATAHTPEGLAVKARALIPAVWSSGNYEDGAALGLDENWDKAGIRDLIDACCKLAGADWQGRTGAGEASRSADHTAGIVEALREGLPTYSMGELRALNDVANLIQDICNPLSFQPRCVADGALKPAGRLIHAFADMCDDLIEATQDEVRDRSPESEGDRATRLALIAGTVIDNGDPDEIAALVRDLQNQG
jgi:hypothetical protein